MKTGIHTTNSQDIAWMRVFKWIKNEVLMIKEQLYVFKRKTNANKYSLDVAFCLLILASFCVLFIFSLSFHFFLPSAWCLIFRISFSF